MDGYVGRLAGWLGMDIGEVGAAVKRAAFAAKAAERDRARGRAAEPEQPPAESRGVTLTELPTDPITRSERDTLMAMVQHPEAVGRDLTERALAARFVNPTLSVVRDAVAASLDDFAAPGWVERITREVPPSFASLIERAGRRADPGAARSAGRVLRTGGRRPGRP